MKARNISSKLWTLLVLIVPVLLTTGCDLTHRKEKNSLFTALTEKELTQIYDAKEPPWLVGEGKEVIRRRLVRFNYQFLEEKVVRPFANKESNGVVEFSLFDDVKVSMINEALEKNSMGIFVWDARPEARFYSRAAISFSELAAYGVIQVDDRIYEIMPVKENVLAVIEYDTKRFPQFGPPIIHEKPEMKPFSLIFPAITYPEPIIIKVLVLLPVFQTSNGCVLPLWIKHILESGYQHNLIKVFNAFQPTFIGANVEILCTSYKPVGGDLHSDLYWVKSDPNVASLRNRFQADLVSLFIFDGDYGGRGVYIEPPVRAIDEYDGFSVVKMAEAISNFALAHELGHNLGMNHDRLTESLLKSEKCNFGSIFAYDDYSFFSRLFPVSFNVHSIMAYASACNNCAPMGVYSNPMEFDLGNAHIGPMGASCTSLPFLGNYYRANNRQQLIDAAPIVSRFR